MWEASVLYSARFFEDDVVHRTYFFALMCTIATGSVSVRDDGVDFAVFTRHYIAAVSIWLLWYVVTAIIVNVALPSSNSEKVPTPRRASGRPVDAALDNMEAVALRQSEAPKFCSFMRKEALASTVSMGLLFVFVLVAVSTSGSAHHCGSTDLDTTPSRDCAMTGGLLVLGVLADKICMWVVWSYKPTWWLRLNKQYLQLRYKRIITMLLGTNVVSGEPL